MGLITGLSAEQVNALRQTVTISNALTRAVEAGLATIDANGNVNWDGPVFSNLLTRVLNAIRANDAILQNATDIRDAVNSGYEIVQNEHDLRMLLLHQASTAAQRTLALGLPIECLRALLDQLKASNDVREV